MMRALEEKVDQNLYIYEFDNHYKSLVKDSDYFLVGALIGFRTVEEKILSALGKMNLERHKRNLTIA